MPCCGGQPLADFVCEVADGRNGGVRLEQPGQVAEVADAAGGAEAGCEVDVTPRRHVLAARPARVTPDELAGRHARLASLLTQLSQLLPDLPGHGAGQHEPVREVSLDELAETGAIFIRRPPPRDPADSPEHPLPRTSGRVLTAADLARAVPPSEVAEVIADDVRNPAIRDGDVLVPLSGRRLTARVATGEDVGAYLSSNVFLVRTDPATVDPWFLAGLLSSSSGGNQATRMASTLGEYMRFDPRRVRIPLPPVSVQQEYGEAFRRLWEFTRTLRAAHDAGTDFVRDMIDATADPLTEKADGAQPPHRVRAPR